MHKNSISSEDKNGKIRVKTYIPIQDDIPEMGWKTSSVVSLDEKETHFLTFRDLFSVGKPFSAVKEVLQRSK